MNRMIARRYMLVKHIGQGGMADVYVAVDTLLNREVAVKILRGELSNDPVALLRFPREANASTALSHPNIVDIYDVGEDEGHHFIVMEYVRGRDLKQLIAQRGALCKEEAVAIMKQLVSAVAEAHRRNIIHRDIKPQNVLIYATSNRRHLIREKFSDKREILDDLHANDTVQEKLSLVARFGVTIYYGAPEKKEFQEIVKVLAERCGVDMEKEELLAEANKWELSHGGLSGRTASQFITHLLGKDEKGE